MTFYFPCANLVAIQLEKEFIMHKEIENPKHELHQLAGILDKTFIQRRDLYAKQLDDGRYIF